METQQDNKVRLLALANLRAMCKRISGMCHTYHVDKVSRSRVTVSYSNPDEFGNPQPVYAVFPCYPSNWAEDGPDNPRIVLDPIRVYGPNADWQMFATLEMCPSLWRHYADTGAEVWESHAEILARQKRTLDVFPCNVCTHCDVPERIV